MRLEDFGWHSFFESHFTPFASGGCVPGRVALEHRGAFGVFTAEGDVTADVAGRLRHASASRDDLPAVGDWVALRARPGDGRARIEAVLPRRSKFARKAAGLRTEEQIVGTNIDTALLVMSLNNDFNPRRIERYLSVVWESGASPVVVLSKADLCAEVEAMAREIDRVALGVPVHAVSVVSGVGLDSLDQYLAPGRTVALLGSSGAGKSTLINRWAGRDVQRVREVRGGDDRGRHTTTHRELIVLPGGGLVLDTPGMRELQLWEADGLEGAFQDVESIARGCRFGDCRHHDEPGCAVRDAVEAGALDAGRVRNYEKLRREADYLARKQDAYAQSVEKERWKKLTRAAKQRSRR